MNRILMIILLVIMITSCKSEYDKMVRNEMAKGIRNDSLIFGIFMGETRKDFYAKCWDLNKEKIVSQGTGNRSVKYIEPVDSLEDPTMRKEMLFYANFDDTDTIRGMDMVYNFTSWAPWNTDRHSDVLLNTLTEIYLEKYGGNEFIPIDLDVSDFKAFVKVDGNRQILMYPLNSKDVTVKIVDLEHKLNQ